MSNNMFALALREGIVGSIWQLPRKTLILYFLLCNYKLLLPYHVFSLKGMDLFD